MDRPPKDSRSWADVIGQTDRPRKEDYVESVPRPLAPALTEAPPSAPVALSPITSGLKEKPLEASDDSYRLDVVAAAAAASAAVAMKSEDVDIKPEPARAEKPKKRRKVGHGK